MRSRLLRTKSIIQPDDVQVERPWWHSGSVAWQGASECAQQRRLKAAVWTEGDLEACTAQVTAAWAGVYDCAVTSAMICLWTPDPRHCRLQDMP